MKKLLVGLVILAIVEISISLYLSIWREHFYNAIVARNLGEFETQTLIFTVVALFYCCSSGISGYLTTLTAIKWRETLNNTALTVKLPDVLNKSQRIQEDCRDYPDLMMNLGVGGVKSVMYILVFATAIVWGFSAIYIAIIIAYAVVGTFLTHYIAAPLVKLNYDSQQAEATYRNAIALPEFRMCIAIMRAMARKQKHLSYFQNFYSQLGVVLPLLLAVPVYFTTNMSVGVLMRFDRSCGTVIDNFGYGVVSFSMINRLRSCSKRLKEVGIL